MVQALLPFPNCLRNNCENASTGKFQLFIKKLRTITISFNFLYQLQYKQLEQIKTIMITFWQEFK